MLHKSQYDLKQTPRTWFETSSLLLSPASKCDPSLVVYIDTINTIYFLVYMLGRKIRTALGGCIMEGNLKIRVKRVS